MWPAGAGVAQQEDQGKYIPYTMDEEEKRSLLLSGDHLSLGDRGTVCSLWRRDLFPVMPARYVLAIMGFLGFFNVYTLRVNLSMAIVAMVNETADPTSHLVRALR